MRLSLRTSCESTCSRERPAGCPPRLRQTGQQIPYRGKRWMTRRRAADRAAASKCSDLHGNFPRRGCARASRIEHRQVKSPARSARRGRASTEMPATSNRAAFSNYFPMNDFAAARCRAQKIVRLLRSNVNRPAIVSDGLRKSALTPNRAPARRLQFP